MLYCDALEAKSILVYHFNFWRISIPGKVQRKIDNERQNVWWFSHCLFKHLQFEKRIVTIYLSVFFYFLSPTDMSYQRNVVLFILLLKQVTEGSGYNCSDFKSILSNFTLVECPPAKFMLKDNLVECFDNYARIKDQFCKDRLIHS